MASYNKMTLLGNVGQDPKTSTTKSGAPMTKISVATAYRHKDQSGEYKEITTWINVLFMGKLAEIAGKYISKGSSVLVDGRLANSRYTGKDGVERTDYFVVAENVQFLDKKPKEPEPASTQYRAPSVAKPATSGFDDTDLDDDIPF